MSNKTIKWFDEMNILQSEKDERVEACSDLQKRLEEDFDWFKENKGKYIELENKMLKSYLVWGLLIGLFEKDELESIEILYQAYGFDFSDIADEIEDNLDIENDDSETSTKEDISETIKKLKDITDDIQKAIETMKKHENDEYYTSEKRAYQIARDKTNQKFNYMKHKKSADGARFHIWKCMGDKYTRDNHFECDGQKKPINVPFEVNGYLMMYPMDDSYGAPIEEIAGCRCSEEFV